MTGLPPLLQAVLDDPPRDGVVRLRPLRSGDLERLVQLLQDPEIPRWTLVPSPYGMPEALAHLQRARTAARERTGLHLMVVDDADDAILGSASYPVLDLDEGYGEIGYWIAAMARGRGICPRAIRLLADHGRRRLGLRQIEILPHKDNAPSRRAAVKAGFAFTGEVVAAPRTGETEPVYAVHRD